MAETQPILTDSARGKFRRALELVEDLQADVTRWQSSNLEVATWAEWEESKPSATIYASLTSPDLGRMSLVLGDIVHNLRSALDHAVSARTTGASTLRRQAAFPITTTQAEFDNSDHLIAGLSPEMREAVRNFQPFVQAPGSPDFYALRLLGHLDNVDKHRAISVAFMNMTTLEANFQFRGPEGEDHGLSVELVEPLVVEADTPTAVARATWNHSHRPLNLSATAEVGISVETLMGPMLVHAIVKTFGESVGITLDYLSAVEPLTSRGN